MPVLAVLLALFALWLIVRADPMAPVVVSTVEIPVAIIVTVEVTRFRVVTPTATATKVPQQVVVQWTHAPPTEEATR